MRRLFYIFLSALLILGMAGCSKEKKKETKQDVQQGESMGGLHQTEEETEPVTESKTAFDIALITGGEDSILDGGKYQNTWKGLVAYAEEEGISHRYYGAASEEAADLREQILVALEAEAKMVIGIGDTMYEAVVPIAQEYTEVAFCILDGSEDTNLLPNVTVLEFDKMEAGYVAGYAAALEGYGSVGFFSYGQMLEDEYQYGFLQGLETAGKYVVNKRTKVYNVNFGATSEEAVLRETLGEWFVEDGIRMVFCCPAAQAVCSELAAASGAGLVTTGDALLITELAAVNGVITKNYTKAVKEYLLGTYENGHHYLRMGEEMINFVMNPGNMTSFTEEKLQSLVQSLETIENSMNRNTKIPTANLGLEYVELAY